MHHPDEVRSRVEMDVDAALSYSWRRGESPTASFPGPACGQHLVGCALQRLEDICEVDTSRLSFRFLVRLVFPIHDVGALDVSSPVALDTAAAAHAADLAGGRDRLAGAAGGFW